MQWIALGAIMPSLWQQSSPAGTISAAGVFSVHSDVPANQQTARFCSDFCATSLRSTERVRLGWCQKLRVRIIPCSPVCAVKPRSRKEWLLHQNLPDSVYKPLIGQEERKVPSDIVAPETLNTEIELNEKQAGKGGNPKAERFQTSERYNSDAATETGDIFKSSDGRKLTHARLGGGPGDRFQPPGAPIVRTTDGDLENGNFTEGNAGATAERRQRVASSEPSRTGREVWTNGSEVEQACQPRVPYSPFGKDGDREIEHSPGSVGIGVGLESSEETLSLKEIWRNASVWTSEARDTVSENEIDCDLQSGKVTRSKSGKGVSPSVTPKLSEGTSRGRDLWKKDVERERHQRSHDPSIPHRERGDLQTRSLEESLPEAQSNPGVVPERGDGLYFPTSAQVSSNGDALDQFNGRGSSFRPPKRGGVETGDIVKNDVEKRRASVLLKSNAGAAKERDQGPESYKAAVEGVHPPVHEILNEQGGDLGTRKVEEDASKEEKILGLLSGNRELVDYNGEKVVEVWRKGKVKKRFKPLGMEFLYGRTKPARLYGPLNSRGEVPGSDLAPVPRRYRKRCEHDQGWNTKEVVKKVLELNHWDDIDAILNRWVGRFNRKNFPPLMLAMTRTGALKHSARLFTWMKNQRCYRARTDIYNLMMWLYARHYRVDTVRALFKEMQEWRCKPDVETYNALINVHGRAQQWQESLLFYDRMLRDAVPPSTGTYNNLISALGNSGQWKKALKLYQKMKSDGVYMDIVTHNTLLTALKVGEQYSMAIAHFEKTLQWEVIPDRFTLNIIISCFSKMERYDEAVQLFNSMMSMKWDGCRPDLFTFTTVMHLYAVCGQVENVKAAFDMMVKVGVVPNVVSYNTLIGAYASTGRDTEALEAFEAMQKAGFEPDIVSYTALMNAYSKAEKPDDAAGLFKHMIRRSRKPNLVTYNTLIDAYSSAGRMAEALGVLADMDFDEIRPNVVTICSLVVACGRSGEMDKVNSILDMAALRKISLNVNVFNTVLSVYMKGGMFEEFDKVYTAMKNEEIHPDSVTFAVLIDGAAKAGDISQAQMYFDEMQSLGVGINVEACSALIHAYAEQGLPEPAHAVLRTMKESGCAPNIVTYTSLIHAYSKAEMPEAATAVFDEMETLGVELDAVACSALFNVFNQCNQPDRTLTLWSKWRDHFHFGTAAFAQLSKACSMLTDWDTAVELFNDMQQVGVKPNMTIGNNLLRSFGKGGKSEQLLKMLDRLKAEGLQPDLITYRMAL